MALLTTTLTGTEPSSAAASASSSRSAIWSDRLDMKLEFLTHASARQFLASLDGSRRRGSDYREPLVAPSGSAGCDNRGLEPTRKRKTPPERGFPIKRLKGLEPSTFCMASRRSSQLSYSREVAEYIRAHLRWGALQERGIAWSRRSQRAPKRRRPESNRCRRLCRPLRSHSATSPGDRRVAVDGGAVRRSAGRSAIPNGSRTSAGAGEPAALRHRLRRRRDAGGSDAVQRHA